MFTVIRALVGGLLVSALSSGEEPVNPEAVQRFRLENGLRVILRPIKGTDQVALLVLYNIGGDHDPPDRSGLAHMVEHLYVTAAAGETQARSAEDFFRRYGSSCNAQTGDRYTVIASVFPGKSLREELRDASERMSALRLRDADLDRERPRMLQEVENMFGRIPLLGAVNHSRELIRPAPRSGRKGGLPEHIKAITADDVRNRWWRFYKPRNAILVLTGGFDPGEAQQAATAQFAQIDPGEAIPDAGEPGRPAFGEVRTLTMKTPLPQATAEACLTYLAPRPGSEAYAPFLVLASRLMTLAPRLGGGPGQFPVRFALLDDPAVLSVTKSVNPGETGAETLARLKAFVAGAVEPKLAAGDVASTRQTLGFLLGLGSPPDQILAGNPYGVAFSLGRMEQLGLDPAKLSQALDSVSDASLRQAADEFLGPDRHAGAVVCPEK